MGNVVLLCVKRQDTIVCQVLSRIRFLDNMFLLCKYRLKGNFFLLSKEQGVLKDD